MAPGAELPQYKVIVNPTDGSTASEVATLHAVYLAKLSGARLLPVYVVDEAAARRAGVNIRRAVDDMRRKGQDVLSGVQDLAAQQGVVVEPLLVEGQTAPTILGIAEERDASLIVMGATAYSDIERLLARAISVSEEMLRGAPCPLLIVRGTRSTDV
ncbi:MAG: universal stress protein [Chloroflexi bacterium]|nr:universal stress protein [Chloroflexota bacterium]